MGHSGRVTEVEGACLFWVGSVPQLEEPGEGAEPVFGSANGLRSGGGGGRGVAGLTRGLRGAHRARERRFGGGGNAQSWGGGGRVQEMAARWSSENVVVEFRDSQVSRGQMEPSGHAPSLVPLPHAAASVSGVAERPPSSGRGDGKGGDPELSDPSGRGEP